MVRGEAVDAQRVVVGQQRQDLVDPGLDVGLALSNLDLLVEQLQRRQRVGRAAVDAAERDRAAAADDLDRRVQRGELRHAEVLHHRLRQLVGQQPGELVRDPGDRGAVGLHADGVDDRVGSTAVGQLTDRPGEVVVLFEIQRFGATSAHPRQPLRDKIDADHALAAVLGDPGGHIPNRPQTEHDQRSTIGHVGIFDALPSRRQHIGEEHEAIIRRALRNLDRQEVPKRNAQQLGLSARHLAVQLGVAKQRRTGAVLVHLGGLALRMQAVSAHPAVAAGNVEWDDDSVADAECGDVFAGRLDDPHRFVPEHVARIQKRGQHRVQVQI